MAELWGVKGGGEDIAWCVRGRMVFLRSPVVMGVLNLTPDSFHAASRVRTLDEALRRAEGMLADGASILDVGGASSRPGSLAVPMELERERVVPVIHGLHQRFPQALISIDTWRAGIAAEAVDAGASMVNDISAGRMDDHMLTTVAGLHVPYILMHMQGTPKTMQAAPVYIEVVADVVKYLSERAQAARQAGIADLIVDPGFGFGKSTAHNFALLKGLQAIKQLGYPVLAGLSRKRMINHVLDTMPEDALNGTTVLNTLALLNGASLLRVHDVKPAMETIKLLSS